MFSLLLKELIFDFYLISVHRLKDMCVSHTHTFLLDSEQCLLKKLYLRSENDTAKEMHSVTHKKENMKDNEEPEKVRNARIYHLLISSSTKRLGMFKNMVLMQLVRLDS